MAENIDNKEEGSHRAGQRETQLHGGRRGGSCPEGRELQVIRRRVRYHHG